MHKLNLIPKEVLINQSKKKRRLCCVIIMGIIVILLIYFILFIGNMKTSFKREIENVSQDIADLKWKMKSQDNYELILQDFKKRNNIYKNITKNKINYSQILKQIMDLKPENITIFSLEVNAPNYLVIEGHAPDNRHVARIIEKIGIIEDISDVSLGFICYLDAKNEIVSGYHFEIIAKLTKD